MHDPILTLYAFAMEDYRGVNEPLIAARQAYFSDPQGAIGPRHTLSSPDTDALIRYQFRKDGFRWSVRLAGKEQQRVIRERDGSYALHVFAPDGSLFRVDHFSSCHILQRVSYYFNHELRGEVIVLPDGTLDASFLVPEEKLYRRSILHPCPFIPYGQEAFRSYTRALGMPPAITYTTTGVVCYYTESDAKQAALLCESLSGPADPVSVPNPSEESNPVVPESLPEKFPEAEVSETTSEPETTALPVISPEQGAEKINKKYYLYGKIQNGKIISHPVQQNPQEEVPTAGELYQELYRDLPELDPNAARSIDLHTESIHWQIQYTAGGVLDYAGELQNNERRGFGVRADLNKHCAFAGNWFCDGHGGVRMQVNENGQIGIQYIDHSTEEDLPGGVTIFDANGTLLYSGDFQQERRHGIGTGILDSGLLYTGQWDQDQPNGNGVLIDDCGVLQYQGQWANGQRHGTGTEYQNGRPCYKGEWHADQYHGAGVLYLDNGNHISAQFHHGQPVGNITEQTSDGRTVYVGAWQNGHRNGQGTLYLSDDVTLEGRFENDILSGEVIERNHEGTILYRGSYTNGQRHGIGQWYEQGQLRYEGSFVAGKRSGRGKCYENGDLVYAGELQDDLRCGIGASLKNGQPVYFGQWIQDRPCGYGLLYIDGKPVYAGAFTDGKRNGRINEYRNDKLYRELICRNDEEEYMIEYENGHPAYAGAVFARERSGLGRLLNEYCECIQQGVFKNGTLVRASQVIPRRLEPLPCPDALVGTPYEEMIQTTESYTLGLSQNGGIYSGMLKDGIPNGPGTISYPDHIFTGMFEHGVPCGNGQLYLCNGEVVSGIFGAQAEAECIQCGPIRYLVRRQ